jgi:hypothetical protein
MKKNEEKMKKIYNTLTKKGLQSKKNVIFGTIRGEKSSP